MKTTTSRLSFVFPLTAALLVAPLSAFAILPSISNLGLHLDAGNAASVITDGNNVTEWRDLSNDIVFTPAGTFSSVSPTLVSNAVNGLPVIRFSTSSLETQSPNALGLTNDISGITMFAVAWRNTGGQNIQNIVRIGSTGSAVRMHLGSTNSGQRIQGRRLNGDGIQTVISGDGPLLDEWGVSSAVVDYANASAEVYLNGGSVASSDSFQTPGNTSATDSSRFWIGSGHDATQYWDGDIAEILIYNRALTSEEIGQVHAYLGEKYDINVIPEPSTYALLFGGSILVVALIRKNKKVNVPFRF